MLAYRRIKKVRGTTFKIDRNKSLDSKEKINLIDVCISDTI